LGRSRKYRRECGQFLAAGDKLLREALRAGLRVVLLAATDPDACPDAAEETLLVPQSLLQSVSPLEDAGSVLFAAETPAFPAPTDAVGLLLDGIQDPGNVGAILRSAYAFGSPCVYLTPGCADVWNPKALRASMGAAFHLPTLPWATKPEGVPLVAAALTPDAADITSLKLGRCILALGNEGHGLSPELLAQCDAKVRIPMSGGMESLGVAQAAAVCLWERQRQLTTNN
jgi:TrmH family RNA methyltransferase